MRPIRPLEPDPVKLSVHLRVVVALQFAPLYHFQVLGELRLYVGDVLQVLLGEPGIQARIEDQGANV